MKNDSILMPNSWLSWDSYRLEYERFNDQAHTLILWTLDSAIQKLKEEAEAQDAKLEPKFSQSFGDERDYYIEQQQKNWEFFPEQERFLRNMALVGLLTLLTHSLNKMLRAALFTSRKKGSYRKPGDSEFAEIWREFESRFQIDFFGAEQERVSFIEPLRLARNLIVHNGGEANKDKHPDDIDLSAGIEDQFDMTFSLAHPELIEEEGLWAKVSIKTEQIDAAVESAVALVLWVSQQLRTRELDSQKIDLPKLN